MSQLLVGRQIIWREEGGALRTARVVAFVPKRCGLRRVCPEIQKRWPVDWHNAPWKLLECTNYGRYVVIQGDYYGVVPEGWLLPHD